MTTVSRRAGVLAYKNTLRVELKRVSPTRNRIFKYLKRLPHSVRKWLGNYAKQLSVSNLQGGISTILLDNGIGLDFIDYLGENTKNTVHYYS